MKNIFVIVISLVLAYSCQNRANNQRIESADSYVHTKPDSLLSEKEIELKRLIGDVLIKNMAIEDNRFVFKLSRKEFLKTGIPEKYYDLLMQNIDDNNKWVDSYGIKNLDSIYQESMNDYKLFISK